MLNNLKQLYINLLYSRLVEGNCKKLKDHCVTSSRIIVLQGRRVDVVLGEVQFNRGSSITVHNVRESSVVYLSVRCFLDILRGLGCHLHKWSEIIIDVWVGKQINKKARVSKLIIIRMSINFKSEPVHRYLAARKVLYQNEPCCLRVAAPSVSHLFQLPPSVVLVL